MLLMAIALAGAAEVTEVPDFKQGDVVVGYQVDLQRYALMEGIDSVGLTTEEQHVLSVEAVVGAPYSAAFVRVPYGLRHRIAYPDTRKMIYDPLEEEGSLATSETQDTPRDAVEGRGLEGIWIGARGVPFSENRGDQSTWVIEAAYRFGDRTNVWSEEGGVRGSGVGAPALQLRTAFSGPRSSHRPYLEATLQRTGSIALDLQDSSGASTGTAYVAPASSAAFQAGVEVLTRQTGIGWFALDFRTRFAYSSWAELPSGFYLPDVLSDTDGVLVTRSEYLTMSGGMGFHWQLFKYLRLGVTADLDVNTPYRLEHPYPIEAGWESVGVRVFTSLRFMIR
jgi:hypothetical protein